ncbi:MAG: methylenetetrahydrofolate reductase C-terminal domain-containing protein [Dongiaceae bacterium]
MYAVRLWSVRHSRALETFYKGFEGAMVRLAPLWKAIGHQRLERPVAALERGVKGLLFDCQMCGQCALSQTGMSCSMNCPKNLRNGPCGGVRLNGHCEVKPEMKCVWVQAWEGARAMRESDAILTVQKPVDNRLKGRSSWLRVVREKTAPAEPAPAGPGPAGPGPAKQGR